MSGHESAILCVVVVEDLSLCVSGSKDASVILWDLNTHEYIRELTGHSGPVGHVGVNEASGNIVSLSGSEMRYAPRTDTHMSFLPFIFPSSLLSVRPSVRNCPFRNFHNFLQYNPRHILKAVEHQRAMPRRSVRRSVCQRQPFPAHLPLQHGLRDLAGTLSKSFVV
jgi:WD40 repeat protein